MAPSSDPRDTRIAELETENERLRAEIDWLRRRRRINSKKRLAGIQRGDWQPFTGLGPLQDHIRAVMNATGIAPNSFGTVSGVGPATIARILNGTYAQASTQVAGKILAVTPETVIASNGNARVDAAGTRRRLQALAAEGWSARQLAQRGTYANYTNLTRILCGRKRRVAASTHKAVADLYDDLDGTLAPRDTREHRISATKAAGLAASSKWAPREAWDETTINDPAAGPRWDWVRTGNGSRSAADTAEDIRDLLSMGEHEELIAGRLGITAQRLRDILRRYPAPAEDGEAA